MIEGLSQYLHHQPVLTLLVICHLLSDYHLQSQTIADHKGENLIYLGYHLVGVGIPLLIFTTIMPKLWWLSLLVFVSHTLIDWMKPQVARWLKGKNVGLFLLDQCLHLVIIVFASHRLVVTDFPNWLDHRLLSTILFSLIVTKPTNIVFKIFFSKYQPDQDQKIDTIAGAGATIGILERIVIGICMVMGQFASIGLVFTAKSIARYNKISESPSFAEYYLIGSLFSILSVFIAAWICFF